MKRMVENHVLLVWTELFGLRIRGGWPQLWTRAAAP